MVLLVMATDRGKHFWSFVSALMGRGAICLVALTPWALRRISRLINEHRLCVLIFSNAKSLKLCTNFCLRTMKLPCWLPGKRPCHPRTLFRATSAFAVVQIRVRERDTSCLVSFFINVCLTLTALLFLVAQKTTAVIPLSCSSNPCQNGGICYSFIDDKAIPNRCPDEAAPHLDACYKLERSRKSWFKAQNACARTGGSLFAVDNEQDRIFMENFARAQNITGNAWLVSDSMDQQFYCWVAFLNIDIVALWKELNHKQS